MKTGASGLTLLFITSFLHGVTMLRIVDLKIPKHVTLQYPVELHCHYDLEGDALYSVKWFKDDMEFYRFIPRDYPPESVINQQGFIIDLVRSSDTVVVLKPLTLNATGNYRCEVSAEAPTFETSYLSSYMLVVDLPDGGPHIIGKTSRHKVGEEINVNCTSYRSRPAASLSWFINQEPVDETLVHTYPVAREQNELETSTLGLKFKISRAHLKDGALKLKCLSRIGTIYWKTNEVSIQGEKENRVPVMESREAMFNSAWKGCSQIASFNLISALILRLITLI